MAFLEKSNWVALIVAVPTLLDYMALVVPQVVSKPITEVAWVQPMTGAIIAFVVAVVLGHVAAVPSNPSGGTASPPGGSTCRRIPTSRSICPVGRAPSTHAPRTRTSGSTGPRGSRRRQGLRRRGCSAHSRQHPRNPNLVRMGVVADLLQAMGFVFLAMTIYLLLKDAIRNAARALVREVTRSPTATGVISPIERR